MGLIGRDCGFLFDDGSAMVGLNTGLAVTKLMMVSPGADDDSDGHQKESRHRWNVDDPQ